MSSYFVVLLTAREVAEQDEELCYEYSRRPEYRLCTMNSKVREQMFDAMIAENEIEGGWYYYFGFAGCLPDSEFYGPYPTYAHADDAALDHIDQEV